MSTLLYVSYGYLTTKVEGNETSKKLSAVAKILEIEYSGGNESLSTDGSFIPGSVLTKTFTIKNHKKKPNEKGRVKVDYKIKLSNVINDFTRTEDLRYELYRDGTLISDDVFPTKDSVIAFNQRIEVGGTYNYKLKVYYDNSNENQIEDQGKIISANLTFEEEPAIKNIKILGNSSLKNNVIQNVGNEIVNLYTEDNMTIGYRVDSEGYYIESAGYWSNHALLVEDSNYKSTDFIKLANGGVFNFTVYNNKNTQEKVYYHFIQSNKDDATSLGIITVPANSKKRIQVNLPDSCSYIKISKSISDDVIVFLEQTVETIEYALEYDMIGKYNVKINEKGLGKNLVDETNYVNSNATTKKQAEYFLVSTGTNTGGIWFNIDESFEIGDKISFQAYINVVSFADETFGDSVTLRIWNATQRKWIYSGSNGGENSYSTRKVNTPKVLKLPNVELKSTNYNKGDKIQAVISRGGAKAGSNNVNFQVFYNTVMMEKGATCSTYEPYIVKVHNIFLDEPLRKVGDVYDYIDFKSRKVVRNVKVVNPNASTIETAYSALLESNNEDNEYIPKLAEIASYANLELRTDLKGELIIEY